MNRKVTLQQLAVLVSRNAGISIEEAEKWTRAYFDLIADTLAAGENVKIKGLGNFKLSGIEPRESIDVSTGQRVVIPGHLRAGFTPEKSVAQEINAPFASFEAVELADNISESELDSVVSAETGDLPQQPSLADSVGQPAAAEVSEVAEVADAEMAETAESEITKTVEAEVAAETENKEPEETETDDKTSDADKADDADNTVVAIADTKVADEAYCIGSYREAAHNRKSMFLIGFLVGLACIFLVLAAIWCWYRFAPESYDRILGRPQPQVVVPAVRSSEASISTVASPDAKSVAGQPQNAEEANSQEAAVATEDAKAEVPTQPSDAAATVVYDTISRTRFLTTMARDHYGSYHLWPYIYMENSKILGHPDRIKPGTRVVIPPAAKYGISASDKACVDKAKKMGVEIYARYR